MKTTTNTLRTILPICLLLVSATLFSQVATQEREVGSFSGIAQSSSVDVFISYGENTSVTVRADQDIIDQVVTKVKDGILEISTTGRLWHVHVMEVHITMPVLNKILDSGSGDISCEGPVKGNNVFIGISGSGDLDASLEAVNLELKISGSGDVDISGVRGSLNIGIVGSGDVVASGLQLDKCAISIAGSGDVKLKGKAENLSIKLSGSGDINTYGLTAVNVSIKSVGSGDVVVKAVEKIDAILNGSGDLAYYGSPEYVNVVANGSGEVYRK